MLRNDKLELQSRTSIVLFNSRQKF
ncbi:hypothetical protein AB3S75_016855 [Citrus x aurantiifolia]